MDLAHLHLMLNHFPILGILFGTFFLIYGVIRKNYFYIKLSHLVFIVIAIITIPAYLTGDGAGEIVKKLPDISEKVIDAHEDLAFIAFLVAIVLGIASLLNLYLNRKNESRFNKTTYGIGGLSIVVLVLMFFVGKTGGVIHHPELRANAQIQKIETLPTDHKN